jgi:hypothetical protein
MLPARLLGYRVAWCAEVDVRFALKATRLLRGIEMARWANNRHADRAQRRDLDQRKPP